MMDAPTSEPPSQTPLKDSNGVYARSAPWHGLIERLRFWKKSRTSEESFREAIADLIEERAGEEETTATGAEERQLLRNILQLRDLTAYDVMVPRADILAVPADATQAEVIQSFVEHNHSRMPVYGETLDEAIGMIHIKDVMRAMQDGSAFELGKLTREVLFVAPSMPVLDLLWQMRLSRIHMALVVDEFGGVDGLVTIEDMVEEIVGEIEDEHDVAEAADLVLRPDGSAIATGRTMIEDFEERFGTILTGEEREEDIDTLGGLITYLVGRLPARGELITHSSGLAFEVLEVDPRRIRRVRIRNLPPALDSNSLPSRAGTAHGR